MIRLGKFDKQGYKDSFSKGELARELVCMNNNYDKLEKENQKYKEVFNKLKEDLNLIIEYGDGEDASRYDKQLKCMSKEDRLNRVLAGLSHTGYTTEIEKCEARLFIEELEKENQELKKQLEEVELIVGLRQKRNLISKFDKEYDEEDKKKNPNRDYAGIMPDAEEVYKRYYTMKNQQKEFIEYLENEIKRLESNNIYEPLQKMALVTHQHNLSKYKEIIGVSNENNTYI